VRGAHVAPIILLIAHDASLALRAAAACRDADDAADIS